LSFFFSFISDIFCFIDLDTNDTNRQNYLASYINSLASKNKRVKIILREKNYGSGGNVWRVPEIEMINRNFNETSRFYNTKKD
jgi:abortive infection bacteriophage resistance protein